jgi:hypothetical protein
MSSIKVIELIQMSVGKTQTHKAIAKAQKIARKY